MAPADFFAFSVCSSHHLQPPPASHVISNPFLLSDKLNDRNNGNQYHTPNHQRGTISLIVLYECLLVEAVKNGFALRIAGFVFSIII